MDHRDADQLSASCPLLRFDSGSWRCGARTPPTRIGADYQARRCLTVTYPSCRRFREASAPGEEMWMRSRRRFVTIVTVVAILAFAAGVGLSGETTRWVGTVARALGQTMPGTAGANRAPRVVESTTSQQAMGSGTPAPIATPEVANLEATPAVGLAIATVDVAATPVVIATAPVATPMPTTAPVPTSTPLPTATPIPTPTPVGTPAGTIGPAVYTVLPGDTLSGVAARYGTSVGLLQAANGLASGAPLQAGQQLDVPGPDGRLPAGARYLAVVQVQAGASLSQIANGFGDTSAEVAAANNISDPNLVEPGWVLVIPLPGAATPAP